MSDEPQYADIFGERLQIDNCYHGMTPDDEPSITLKYTPNGDKVEIKSFKGNLLGYKVSFKKGGEEHYNHQNKKEKEITKEGIVREFRNGKVSEEKYPDDTRIVYFENGIIEAQYNPDGSYIKNYENGKLKEKGNRKDDSIFSYSPEGKLQYKVENKELWYDPEYYSYIRIGMKTKDNAEHWTEDFILDPKKKTCVSYGGDATKERRAGNGNINVNLNMLGFTDEQKNNIQMLAHYNPKNTDIIFMLFDGSITNWKDCVKNDYRREILKAFHPFIAKKTKQGWEKLPPHELLENMRNILNITHCYGTNELVSIEDIFSEEMQKLGYRQDLIDKALKQNLSITNNSQRDFMDEVKTTTLHRYSVCDGQGESVYDESITNSYPAHLSTSVEYNKLKGNKSSFIKTGNNEVIMAFDKILSDSTKSSSQEHDAAFFTTNPQSLTEVGKKQLKLIQSVAQWWYNNHDEMPEAETLVKQCGQDAGLAAWVKGAFASGKLLQTQHHNPLRNPHVLEVAKNRFNNPDIEPKYEGIWKFLQDAKQNE